MNCNQPTNMILNDSKDIFAKECETVFLFSSKIGMRLQSSYWIMDLKF